MGYVDLTEDEELLTPIEVRPESRRAADEASRILEEYGADEALAGLGAAPPPVDDSPPVGLRYSPDGVPEPRQPTRAGRVGTIEGGPVDSLPLSPRALDVDRMLRGEVEAPEPVAAPEPVSAPMPDPEPVDPEIEREALRALQRSEAAPPPPAAPPPTSPARALGDPAAAPPSPASAPAPKVMDAADEGPHLITDSDIGDARLRDGLREIPSRIGRALRAYAGRPQPGRGPSEASQLEARQRSQGETLRQTKASQEQSRLRAEALDERRAGRDAAQAAQAEQREAERARRDAELGLAERRTAAYEDAQGSLSADRQARRAAAEQAVEEQRDPRSSLAEARRIEYREAMELARSQLGDQFAARVGVSDEQLDGMSAQQIERLLAPLSRIGIRGRRAGSGHGGGATRQGLVQAYVEAGGDERAAAAMSSRQLAAAVETRGREAARHSGPEGGVQILPGVYASVDINDAEASRIRDGFAVAQGQMASLRRVLEIQGQHSGADALTPDARARLIPELTLMRGMVATLGNTGTINEGEVPTINAALPNPAELEQMSFGTFQARLGQWRRAIEDSVRGRLGARGVPQDQIERAIGALWSGSWSAGGGGGGGGGRAEAGGSPEAPAEEAEAVSIRVRSGGREGTVRARPGETLEQLRERVTRTRGVEVVDE